MVDGSYNQNTAFYYMQLLIVAETERVKLAYENMSFQLYILVTISDLVLNYNQYISRNYILPLEISRH